MQLENFDYEETFSFTFSVYVNLATKEANAIKEDAQRDLDEVFWSYVLKWVCSVIILGLGRLYLRLQVPSNLWMH